MSDSYLLDTSFCADLLRRRMPPLERLNAASDQLHLSTITLFELSVSPSKRGRGHEELEMLTSRLQLLDFDARAAAHAASIRAALERQGTPIGPYDVLIAGHARSLGMVLVTSNLREFERVDGLRCEDWRLSD